MKVLLRSLIFSAIAVLPAAAASAAQLEVCEHLLTDEVVVFQDDNYGEKPSDQSEDKPPVIRGPELELPLQPVLPEKKERPKAPVPMPPANSKIYELPPIYPKKPTKPLPN